MKDWKITVSREALKVEGVQLAAPQLVYNGRSVPKSADWGREIRDAKLIDARVLSDWILLLTSRDRSNAHDLVNNMRQVGEPIGMRVKDPQYISLRDDHIEDYLEEIRRNVRPNNRNDGTQMVVCILPTNKKDRYDAIKLLCCHELGIPSQCVVGKTLARKQSLLSVCTKIIQQINCKLGGQLWKIDNVRSSCQLVTLCLTEFE